MQSATSSVAVDLESSTSTVAGATLEELCDLTEACIVDSVDRAQCSELEIPISHFTVSRLEL